MMTKLEALARVLAVFTVRARQVNYDYDPAGSTTSYVPNETDVEVLTVLAGKEVTEKDLFFICGGERTYFALSAQLIETINGNLQKIT